MMTRGTRLLTKDIFIDTDCISAFLWVGNESLLSQLYPNRVVMPKPVYDAIDRPTLAWMKTRIDSMISAGKLTVVELTSGTDEFDLYYKLQKILMKDIRLSETERLLRLHWLKLKTE